MAEPIVSFLLETIGHLLIEEGKFLSGVSEEAELLHSELKMMRALLKDADEKQHETAAVKEWVSQSKDLAYAAENVLETHAFKLQARNRARDTGHVIWRYACILNECYIRHKVGLEIQSLNARVSNLRRSFQEYGIRAVTEREGSSSRQQQLRITYPYVADEEDFVGLERDIEKLSHALVNETEVFGVVSIYGMGGSGKTTLARMVYNHPNVKCHFDSFAWVCISQQWQTRDILQGILVSFFPSRREEFEKWRDDEMVGELLQVQQNRNCLVVLDDIWSTDAWECIKAAFPLFRKGNKILLTTRNKDVAMHIGPNGFHHESRLLTDAESWELLQRKALRGRHIQGDGGFHDLEALGREMVKFCGGLPLAVVVLGGILATKHSSNEWNAVHRNIKSYLAKGESFGQHRGEVHKILALSYDNLPYKLKPCFLYLSAFAEDEDIPTERLYQLWLAEGMVFVEDQMGQDESMMDIAERYLGELAKRCMVHVHLPIHDDGMPLQSARKYSSCRIHDLMRDFCIAKATEENFSKVLNYRQGKETELACSTSSTGNIHRHIIYLGDQDASEHVQEGETSENLRTLVFCTTKRGAMTIKLAESKLNMFKMLRSLTIQGVTGAGLENIKSRPKLPIGHLIHLRYLSLRGSAFCMSPSSISRLEHLETLDLLGAEIVWTRNVPLRMQQLRYLYLPSDMPVQIYGSTNLEILRGIDPGKVVRDLSELTNVQDLYADMRGPEGVEEVISCISQSRKLNHGTVWTRHIAAIFGPEKSLALLRQLLRCDLQYLWLDGPLGKLPEYESSFCRNIVEVNLRESKLKEDPIAILERLPNLQTLRFWNHSFMGTEMVCHSTGFSQLRFLLFHHLHNLKDWTVEEGAMPNLRRLHIFECGDLTMIPEGLKFIEPLQELLIRGMPDEFVNRIQWVDGKKGEDFDKICHISSVRVLDPSSDNATTMVPPFAMLMAFHSAT